MQRFKSFDGVELAFEVAGQGPAVLLLHGFAAESETNWVRPRVVEALLQAGRRVMTLDARGHGQSEKPHDPQTYADNAMVRDVGALLDRLDVGTVDVCGYSMGAMTAYSFAGLDRRARSVVLGGVGDRLGEGIRAGNAVRIADALVAADPATIADPRGRAFRAFADSTGADRRALAAIQRARAASGPSAAPIPRVPALVIAGNADTLVGSPQQLAHRIPGARAKIVSGDHLTAVFDPAFRQAVVDFLAAVDEAAPASVADGASLDRDD